MKKVFIVFLLQLMAIMSWATIVQIEGCWYSINEIEGTALFTRPNSSYRYSGDVTILPSFFYDDWTYHVIGINSGAFASCTSLKSVVIPNSITSIGGSAFYGCSGLTSITIPNSVTNIGYKAFSGCTGLTTITLPNSVTDIGSYAFSDCQNLTSISLLSDSITCIDKNTFENCRNLTAIVIPNGATSIGENAFKSCASLVSITIPQSIRAIGQTAFDGCSKLTSVYITDIASWCAINFESNPLWNMRANLYLNGNIVTDLVIPGNVKSIGSKAFQNYLGLASIIIATGVEEIQSDAFRNCKNLSSVTLPNSITSIGHEAFKYCNNLSSITLPNSITSIGYEAFDYCSSLTSVSIPNRVTEIDRGTFGHCTNLISVDIPNSVTSIDYYAFCYCINLALVKINKTGTSCISIYDEAFTNCHSLTTIDFSHIKHIGNHTFSYCYSLFADLKDARWLDSKDDIGSGAFYDVPNVSYNHSSALQSDNWGARCIDGYIEGYLVYDNYKKLNLRACSATARDVIIPNGVTQIYTKAFTHCAKMTSVTIPSSVTDIRKYAFEYCSCLKTVTIEAETPPTLEGYTFESSDSLESIYVPCGYNRHYIYNTQWKAYKSLIKYLPLDYSLNVIANHGSVICPTICDEDTILTVLPDENYHFVQWSDGITDNPRKIELTQDTTFTAEIAINSYFVRFFGFNEELLDSQSVEHGTSAIAPDAPSIEHYNFVGWDKDFTNITSDLDVFAIYQKDTEGVEKVEINITPQKIAIDGQILIIQGEKVYTITGNEL